jgi:hypothetical protein
MGRNTLKTMVERDNLTKDKSRGIKDWR